MTGTGLALGLLGAAWVASRGGHVLHGGATQRTGQLRLPAGLLLGYVLLVGLRWLTAESAVGEKVALAALFFLLLSMARSALVVLLDGVLARIQSVPDILRDIAWFGLVIVCGMAIFRQAGADLGSLLTTSALITAVLGLAMQETLGNLVAGLAMQARPPFEPGDWIEIDGQLGAVREFNWRATHLRTNDNTEVIVPNGQLARARIINLSRPTSVIRRNVRFQGPYEVPPCRVIEIVEQGILDVPAVLPDPPPDVLVESYDESGVVYWVRFHIYDVPTRDVVDSDVRVRIWYLLDRAGISIPYPTRMLLQRPPPPIDQADRELDRRVAVLAAADLLSVLPRPSLRTLASRCRSAHFSAGERIVRQGDAGSEMFVVVSGDVSVTIQTRGEEAELCRLGPHGVFGEMSILTGGQRTASVRATRPTEVLVLPKDGLEEVVRGDPAVLEALGARLARRQAELAVRSEQPADESADESDGRDLISRIRAFFSRSEE